MRLILLSLIFVSFGLQAQEMSAAKISRLAHKGEKIAQTLCTPAKLPAAKGTIEQVMEAITRSGACPKLSHRKLQAIAYYVSNGSRHSHAGHLHVPHGAKCPVCGMFVGKYPKWAARIEIDGHKHYFDGVKDMMKYYIFDADFPYDRNKISRMDVTDYYTLEAIPAREAYYVLGSKQYGPMGNELIPFKTEKEARDFITDHGGDRIVRFKDITPKMVMGLDGIEIN